MDSISFFTWNLAMLERSDFAPSGWRMDQSEAAVRELVLAADCDVVMFQELPGLIPYIDTHDMAPANARGQTGDIATLVRRDLMPKVKASRINNAVLVEIAPMDLTIANVHLPSGRGGDEDRTKIIKEIKSGSKSRHLAIIGDTNTRTKEEESIAKLGLLGDRPPEPTWNGTLNKFRQTDRNFTAYFTRAFHSDGLKISDPKVWTQPIERQGKSFHLSDHFAMSGQIKRARSPEHSR